MSPPLPEPLARLLAANAEALDRGVFPEEDLLPLLGEHELLRVGVPEAWGGVGGEIRDAVVGLTQLAEHSLTAAFVLWGQRTTIEYLLQSPNDVPRERHLAPLLRGELAGASALSNAMKFLAGIEELETRLTASGGTLRLDGRAPWVTNLRKGGFLVAVTARAPREAPPWVLAVPSSRSGLARAEDFQLLGLGSSNTAALRFEGVEIREDDVLHRDALAFVASVRPAFLGLQCGLAVGLARASLRATREHLPQRPTLLRARAAEVERELTAREDALLAGLADGTFQRHPRAHFALRIELARWAQTAVELELAASGGRAYLSAFDRGFARRWREAAFLPILTPSLVQLAEELDANGGAGA